MPRYARKSKATTRYKRVSRYNRRTSRYSRKNYRVLSRRISAVSRRIAGEVCKFESTPKLFTNSLVTVGTSSVQQTPLTTITSGTPWIMPINWIYQQTSGVATGNVYIDGSQRIAGEVITASIKNPLWYNTSTRNTDLGPTLNPNEYSDSPGLQYRLKYIYINALFNASIISSQNNTDGALRIVIVKDKQPTGGAATWADLNNVENSRGVFNADRIDAQLNPNTVGRFKIMYDKTLRFNTINGYKPFKYYKQLSTIVRNNRDVVAPTSTVNATLSPNNITYNNNDVQSSSSSPPVQKNAFYIMIFSDGLNFTYSEDPSTPAASFHLFNRVAYYNN